MKVLIIIFFAVMSFFPAALAQQVTHTGAEKLYMHLKGKTAPLRDLIPKDGTPPEKRARIKAQKPKYVPPNFLGYDGPQRINPSALPHGHDPILQDFSSRDLDFVEPNFVVEGIPESESNAGVPDTNGDVGPDHFVQIINASYFQVFSKDGTPMSDIISTNTIWEEVGLVSFGDPIIQYDEVVDRWLLTDLASFDHIIYAISDSGDPLGTWTIYDFVSDNWMDYPKYGIWPTGYVLTVNDGGDYPVYIINRDQMLTGEAEVDIQRVMLPVIEGGFPTATPVDWNGTEYPETDEMLVVRLNDDAWGNGNTQDQVEVFSIEVDWSNPDSTSFAMTELVTAAYDSDGCRDQISWRDCIDQPLPGEAFDGIMTIVMNKSIYRNFGDYESFVLNFSVKSGYDVSGVRWMEIRRTPGNAWEIYQESTYAMPDTTNRFIGSLAMNSKGSIGLAYSVSGENTYPSLRFTGRQANDPLNEMSIQEYDFANAVGYLANTDRYGDYALMTVDPIDDSFWFTGEYVKATGEYGTKILNFSIDRDSLDLKTNRIVTPVSSGDLSDTETVSVEFRNSGLAPITDFQVGYSFENGTVEVESPTIDTLFPDETYVHEFSTTVDMSVVGDYHLSLFCHYSQDMNDRNDTIDRVITKMPRFDANMISFVEVKRTCDSEVVVEAIIKNAGVEVLTQAQIQYQLNDQAWQSQPWTGSLSFGEKDTFEISLMNLVSGENTIVARSENPNGMLDEVMRNDTITHSFLSIHDGVDVIFELLLDDYPTETSWKLFDSQGIVLYEGGGYKESEWQSFFSYEWCLQKDSCYQFTIYDSYGDGLSDSSGGGHYEIKLPDGKVLASLIEKDFGDSETKTFCVEPCNLQVEVTVSDVSGSGISDGTISINPSGGAGDFSYSIDGGNNFVDTGLFDGLVDGTYEVVVLDANECRIDTTIVVDVMVGIDDLDLEAGIKVHPNPSSDGVFRVDIHGVNSTLPINIQVIASNGKVIRHKKIPRVDDVHSGLVSLYDLPSGIYYLVVADSRFDELVKLVKE